MKQADKVTGAVLFVFFLGVLFESRKMPMVYITTTGPGFLPFWLSLILAGLSVLLLINGFRQPVSESPRITWPRGRGLFLIGVTIAGLLAYTFLIPIAGYILSTFTFLWLLVQLLGCYEWYWSSGLSLSIAIGMYLVFQVILGVTLPTGLLIIP